MPSALTIYHHISPYYSHNLLSYYYVCIHYSPQCYLHHDYMEKSKTSDIGFGLIESLLSGSLLAAVMLTIREYLMLNKYTAEDGERSAANQAPDLFPLMMYIYYAILFLAVLSSFTKSHALRSVSTMH